MIKAKNVLFLLLLVSCLSNCSHSQGLSRDQETVVLIIREGLSNPSSYEPITWAWIPYLEKDVDARNGYLLLKEARGEQQSLKLFSERQASLQRDLSRSKKVLAQDEVIFKREYKRRSRLADSLKVVASSLMASTDTTRLGTVLYHVYRLQKRTGEIVTDTLGHILLADQPGKMYPLTLFDTLTTARTKRLIKH